MKYVAAILDGDDKTAFGVFFPELAGCFSAGDSLEEALENTAEALDMHIEVLLEDGEQLPPVIGIEALKEQYGADHRLYEFEVDARHLKK